MVTESYGYAGKCGSQRDRDPVWCMVSSALGRDYVEAGARSVGVAFPRAVSEVAGGARRHWTAGTAKTILPTS